MRGQVFVSDKLGPYGSWLQLNDVPLHVIVVQCTITFRYSSAGQLYPVLITNERWKRLGPCDICAKGLSAAPI